MSSGPSALDLIQQTTEAVAEFIEWLVALLRNDDWFKLLVLAGVGLSLLGTVFQGVLVSLWPGDAAPDALWVSLWTAVVLAFVGAFVVALVKRPRAGHTAAADTAERRAIKGLRPFGPEDVEIFAQLQRQTSLRECLESVTSPSYKFGILMGESGCGKTSFLQAGLWPKLQADGCSHRGVLVRFSDQEPLETIRKALIAQLGLPPDSGLAGHGRSPFLDLLHQAVATSGKPIVLLCDQFEQVFVHYRRPEDRAPFVQTLTAWYKTPALDTVKLLVSIRADLLHELFSHLLPNLGFVPGLQDFTTLDRFTPAEAAKILGVIAHTEHLAFDPRFVEELASQELASPEGKTISPVDLQILALMIERQKSDDLRAFNREAFQKFGGVEGLLTRFLESTLNLRVLPNQREAAVKTLLALTDLDRQVRAGALTLPEIEAKLQGDVQPVEIADAVRWLASDKGRLITPLNEVSPTRYELANERIIPSLAILAGKEHTSADRVSQLLERRVNEWLGNQKNPKYLLNLKELWQIQRHRAYVVRGTKINQKKELIESSYHQLFKALKIAALFAFLTTLSWAWLAFTPFGKAFKVQHNLNIISRNADDFVNSEIAISYIKNGQIKRGFNLLENRIQISEPKVKILSEVANIIPRIPSESSRMELLRRAEIAIQSFENDPEIQLEILEKIKQAHIRVGNEKDSEAVIDLPRDIENGQAERGRETSFADEVLEQAENNNIDNIQAHEALQQVDLAISKIETGNEVVASQYLEQAILASQGLKNGSIKQADLLSAIVSAYGHFKDKHPIHAGLTKVIGIASDPAWDPVAQARVLSAAAAVYRTTKDVGYANKELLKILEIAQSIGSNPWSQAEILRAVTMVYAQISEPKIVHEGLSQIFQIGRSIIGNPRAKALVLRNITLAYQHLEDADLILSEIENVQKEVELLEVDPVAYATAFLPVATLHAQLGDIESSQVILADILSRVRELSTREDLSEMFSVASSNIVELNNPENVVSALKLLIETANEVNFFDIFNDVVPYQYLYGDYRSALTNAKKSSDRGIVLAKILTHSAENKIPQLIDGPIVLDIKSEAKVQQDQRRLEITIQSPDENCEKHADWVEILTEDGDLIDRYLINNFHRFEQPFTISEAIAVDPEQVIIVRAHFSNDIGDRDSPDFPVRYPSQAMKGTISKGFKSVRIPPRFAARVERQGPQPAACRTP